ncbi:hypothetical protein RCL1_008322 [Eukaryota sp. TZLM3-RCL]
MSRSCEPSRKQYCIDGWEEWLTETHQSIITDQLPAFQYEEQCPIRCPPVIRFIPRTACPLREAPTPHETQPQQVFEDAQEEEEFVEVSEETTEEVWEAKSRVTIETIPMTRTVKIIERIEPDSGIGGLEIDDNDEL